MSTLQKILVDRSLLGSFVDFVPCPLAFVEQQAEGWMVLYLNRAFHQSVGYTLDDIPTVPQWWRRAYPDREYRSQLKSQWEERIHAAKHTHTEEVIMRTLVHTAHQGDKWYDLKVTLWDQYQVVALLDVHDLELRNQQLMALNTAKDNLLSVLTHDVRGPLQRIQMMLDMFAKDYMTKEELTERLASVGEEVGYALQTIEQTLDWVHGQGIKSRIQEVDVEELVYQILDAHQYLAKRKEISLEAECAPAIVNADPEVMRIMVRNLLNNALKFTDRKGTVTLRTSLSEEGLSLSVEDTGRGLEANQIQRILKQEGYSELGTENEVGSGIGLSIVRNLAREHNVWFSIDSKPGRGSTFTLLFPQE